jgi:hypothetical protein
MRGGLIARLLAGRRLAGDVVRRQIGSVGSIIGPVRSIIGPGSLVAWIGTALDNLAALRSRLLNLRGLRCRLRLLCLPHRLRLLGQLRLPFFPVH